MKTRSLVRKRGFIRGLAKMEELAEIREKLLELSNLPIQEAKKQDASYLMEKVTQSENPFEELMFVAPELHYLSKVV